MAENAKGDAVLSRHVALHAEHGTRCSVMSGSYFDKLHDEAGLRKTQQRQIDYPDGRVGFACDEMASFRVVCRAHRPFYDMCALHAEAIKRRYPSTPAICLADLTAVRLDPGGEMSAQIATTEQTIWLRCDMPGSLIKGRLEQERFGVVPFGEVPASPYYSPAPGGNGRAWMDADGLHVVHAHDCMEGRDTHILPWPTWQAVNGAIDPSYNCDCGYHERTLIAWTVADLTAGSS